MEMLVKAYGDAAMKRTALHKWYSRYENGYESVMDEQRSGRQTSITSQRVQEIKELLDKDRRITFREVSQRIDCSVGTFYISYQQVLNRDLLRAMRKKRAPLLLTMLIHHDNAPSHRASTTQETINRRSIEVLGHLLTALICPPVIYSCSPH